MGDEVEQARRRAEERHGLGLGLEEIRVEVEERRVTRDESFDLDGELEAFAAFLEVPERHALAGLVEELADDAEAHAPALVALDGAVEALVLAPCDLEAGDGSGLEQQRAQGVCFNAQEEMVTVAQRHGRVLCRETRERKVFVKMPRSFFFAYKTL